MTEASTPDKARARTTSLRGRIPALSAAQADAMRKLFAAPVCWPLRDERMLCLAPPVSGKGLGGLFELEGDGSRLALRLDTVQAPESKTVRIAFVADNPGKWLLASTVMERFDAGLWTWIEVT